jgi:hypothetical protein
MLTKKIEFARDLIKGRIVEVIFEQMMRLKEEHDVIPFGYEHTMPMLAQHQDKVEIKKIIQNISDAPDFVLISNDKTKIYLVEVKYQEHLDIEQIKKDAYKLRERWESPWLFVATPNGFKCATCKNILEKNFIVDLPESWVSKEIQSEFLKLLKEFEK